MHMLSLVTVGAIPEHRCFIPGVDTDDEPALWNSTDILSAIPSDGSGSMSSCQMYSGNDTVSCSKYVYDKTYYQTTRATEWDFVCDKRWMIAIAQVNKKSRLITCLANTLLAKLIMLCIYIR